MLRLIALIAVIIAALHLGAMQEEWYYKFAWFDIIMHFLGGLFVGLVAWWYATSFNLFATYSNKSLRRSILIISAAIVVGLLWEVFEYLIGLYFVSIHQYALDTILDLIMDILGASAIVFISHKNIKL